MYYRLVSMPKMYALTVSAHAVVKRTKALLYFINLACGWLFEGWMSTVVYFIFSLYF